MKNSVKIDHLKKTITMYRTFAKRAEKPENNEYIRFQEIRREFPDYNIAVRGFKKNPGQEHYKGLTYDYMKDYIQAYEPLKTRQDVLDELEKKIVISHCHSKRYPAIKEWFLEKYPEVKEYGVIDVNLQEQEITEEHENLKISA